MASTTDRSSRVRPGVALLPESRLAFSLIELAIAFVIMGLAMVPVIGLFSTSGKQARQTGDYSLATISGSKVANELELSSWENVHLPELIEHETALTAETPVVGGTSPYFAVVEDDIEPFGEIRNGIDRPLGPAHAGLSRQLETFKVRFDVRKITVPADGSYDLVLKTSWTDFLGKPQATPYSIRLPEYGQWVEIPPEVADREKADQAIAGILYGKPGGDLSGIVSSRGGDFTLIRDLGDVVLVWGSMMDSMTKMGGELGLAYAGASSTDPKVRARAQVAVARVQERQAYAMLQAQGYLSNPMKALAAAPPTTSVTVPPAWMGNPPPAAETYFDTLTVAKISPIFFGSALGGAWAAYGKAFNSPHGENLPPRLRIRVFMKYVEITRLRMIISGTTDLTPLRTILEKFEKHQAGKNPNFATWARVELDKCRTLDTLKEAYPLSRYGYGSWDFF